MPAEANWHVPKHVIYVRLYGDVTASEMTQRRDSLGEFIAASEPPLILLLDALDVTKLTPDFGNILQGLEQIRNSGQITRIVVISGSTVANFLTMLASRFLGAPMHTFRSMEEANAFLARYLPILSGDTESE